MITYCINNQCPFKECERHLSKISEAYIDKKGYVSVANYDGMCRKYISYLVDVAEGGTEE